jgi:GT2 family glycosyltransferase
MSDTTAIVACFNYGAYLREAVDSLLGQDGGAPHVVVVDDGSTEPATHAALDALPGEVQVVRQENAGVVAARNAGLARARTPFVLFLDAYGHQRFFGSWDAEMRFPEYDALRLLDRHLIGLTALTRREVLDDTGGFDPSFEAFEDWELWLSALAHGHRGVLVDAVTLEYRRHGASKVGGDRRAYRRTRRRLREKHRSLYASRRALAQESSLGRLGRLAYRLYWGPRPLPASVERALYDIVFRRR